MMKAGLLGLAVLFVATAAQPHRHPHVHKAMGKRDVDVVTKTDIVYATAPAAVVYVNSDGDPVSTSFSGSDSTASATPSAASISAAEFIATSSSSASSSSTASSPSSYAPSSTPYSTSSAAPETFSASSSTPSTAASFTSSAAAASSSSSSSSANAGFSLAYSPYYSNGDCKDQDAVNKDFDSISGYSMIRTYGTDCNQTATVLTAASAKGMKLMAGVYDLSDANLPSELKLISDAATANGGWSNIDTVAIGNEAVNGGTYSVSQVVSAINTARSTLKNDGFTGKIVTIDTFTATISNPELCENSDYAAVNAHPFFDGGVTAQDSGTWLLEQVQRVSSICGGKDTVVTETGWPWQGETNGKAVPSSQNQKDAINSIKSSVSNNVILFTSFNDYWKTDSSTTFGAEKYWGFMGDAPSG